MNLNEKIMHLRKVKGITQDELAQRLNISRQAVYKWEIGQSTPDIDNLKLISSIFGVTIDYLLNDSLDMPPQIAALGKVVRSANTPDSIRVNDIHAHKTEDEKKKLHIRKIFVWLTGIPAIAFAIFFVAFLIALMAGAFDAIGFPLFITTMVGCLIFGIAWLICYKCLFRTSLFSNEYFSSLKDNAENYLKQNNYYFKILQPDLPVWFYFDNTKKVFGFYFDGAEQLLCPIQNYFSFTCTSYGQGIQKGDGELSAGVIAGDVAGVSLGRTANYVMRDSTNFKFSLVYLDENGRDVFYEYSLHTYREYSSYMFDGSIEDQVDFANKISHSTTEAFNQIKNKLEVEKEKYEMML